MQNFIFHAPTKMIFGKGQIEQLPTEMESLGKRVLLVYGSGSIKKNGIYQEVYRLLKEYTIVELGGVEPNPRIETVEEGARLCRDHAIDVVLAVGGGSTIDCAKVISAARYYEGKAWDIVLDGRKITKALPIVTILTLAATGSEMNKNAVISNMQQQIKKGTASACLLPKVSILDPQYTYTLPPMQTAAGTADIMSHILENYFKEEPNAFVQDRFAEGLLQTCIQYGPLALKKPTDYVARANLMWASSMALNGLTGSGKEGKWSCHAIEHELSAFYDITHGIGLAIVTPQWMRYILNDKTVDTFVAYATKVWHITGDEAFGLAKQGIAATEQFFSDCGLPKTLTEVGIDDTHFDMIAERLQGVLQNAYVPLDASDIKQILTMCL